MGQPGGEPATSYCYRHPQREALIRCTRCDRPICPDCMRTASVGFHCPDDVDRAAKTVRAPRTSVGARLIESPPYVTGTLIALNVAAYLVTGLAAGSSLTDPYRSKLFQDWVLAPALVHYDDEYYRLITSTFLHLGLLHIASNMLALGLIGPALESVLGRWRFAAVYLLSGIGGSAAVFALGSEINATAGASGAIFGLFGACLILGRRIGVDMQSLIGVIVLNFVLTFSISGISKLGHIGGFVTGIVAGLIIGGLPNVRRRVPTAVQGGGLAGLLVVLLVIVGVRTAVW